MFNNQWHSTTGYLVKGSGVNPRANERYCMSVELKAGDVVRLKSGGPAMTIIDGKQVFRGVDSQATLQCYWFDKKSCLRYGWFVPETLNFPIDKSA